MRFTPAELTIKRNRILVNNPHPQSLAFLVLLCAFYNNEAKKDWLAFRHKFLQKQIRTWWKPWTWLRPRTLTCSYCKRTNLREEVDMSDKSQLKYLATVDHIHPVSKGGKVYDESNCCVACHPCNTNKKDKIL